MLERALLSVLRQTERDFEVVVVDDGSSDDSGDVARRLLAPLEARGRIIALPASLGIPSARNAALAAATGRIAASLDSDDLWHPRFLSVIRAAFAAHPAALFAFTDYLSLGPRMRGFNRQFPPRAVEGIDEDDPIALMVASPFIHTMSCFAAPMEGIRRAGGFNPRLKRFSDLDLYVRLLAGPGPRPDWTQRPFLVLGQALVLKEMHLNGRTLESYREDWEAGKRVFLAEIFAQDCLKGRPEAFRAAVSAGLDAGQQAFFRNFAG
jgi:glycosyltransferase involved in cell wall biosynthesis